MISFFIPIRKGSKRVKNKNIKPLPGFKYGVTELKLKQLNKLKNLLEKTKTQKLKRFEFIISTDCLKTKKFVSRFDWIKVHNRPKKLATDDSLDLLIKEVPKICNGEYILWTHVTSPFFDEIDYINFLNTFFKTRLAKNKSAFSADILNKFIFKRGIGWISHNVKKKKWPRTQDLKDIYTANSAAFIAHKDIYKKFNDRICNNTIPIKSRENSGFDLDNKKDFIELRKFLKEKS